MKTIGISTALFALTAIVLTNAVMIPKVRAQVMGTDGRHDTEESPAQIVGSWDIIISGTPFRILRTYDSAGGVVDAYAFPPFTSTQGPLVNSGGHGVWTRLGSGQFAVVVKYFQLDPRLNATLQILDSFGVVREVVQLDKTKAAYISTFSTSIFRPNGSFLRTNTGRTEAQRIAIESF